MTALFNDASEGTNGTTVSTGNTGGTNENAADVVNIPSGATLAFDNTQTIHSPYSFKIATGATGSGTNFEWTTQLGSQSLVYFRLYYYFTANPASGIRIWQGGASSIGASLNLNASGKLLMNNLSSGATITTSTNSIPLNQWFRVEGFVLMSATVGQTSMSLFSSADSTTATETNTSAATLNLGAATISTAINGLNSSVANIGPYWMANVGLSTVGLLGPKLLISTSTLPAAQLDNPYSSTLAATGGTGSGQTWTVTSGSLPTGLSLSSSGVITGTPTVTGTSSFTVKLTDSSGNVATQALTLVTTSAFVTNLCVNPSFEESIAGWNPLQGTTIAQDPSYSVAGQNSMLVNTDGFVAGEGFYGPVSASVATPISAGDVINYWNGQNGQASIATVIGSPQAQVIEFQNFSGVMGYAVQNGSALAKVTVTAGNSYTVYGWFYSPTGQVQLGMLWSDGTLTTNLVTVTPNSWEYISTTVTAPAGETYGYPAFGGNATSAYAMFGSLVQVYAEAAATTGAISAKLASALDDNGNPISGLLNIAAVTPDGTLLMSTTVAIPSDWTQFGLAGFTVPAGETFRLVASTNIPQALSFWIDAVQYETGVTVDSPYIDGDSSGCIWDGVQGLSASQKLYENVISAKGVMSMTGRCAPIVYGLPVYISAKGSMTLGGKLTAASGVPTAAFADFAIFELTDPDPAMTYADQNNAGTTAAASPSYAASYGIFYPPLDYPVSNGNFAWRRAAFMAAGFYFTAVPSVGTVNVTDIQATYAPLVQPNSSTPQLLPPAFQAPRQINTIIKPTRLNYCTNPSFEVATTGWNAVAGGSVVRDPTQTPSASYDTLLQVANLPVNNVGISTDGSGSGNFDGFGTTYSSTALAGQGLGLYSTLLASGIEYTLPQVQAGDADNVICLGQTIPVNDSAGATVVGFLGASAGETGGATGASGTVTFTYTDGSTSSQFLGLSDWTLGAGAYQISYGNQVAVTTTYRNTSPANGYEQTVQTYMFTAMLPLTPGKTLASITLPANSNMHVFAISAAEVQTNTSFGSYSGKVTVTASGDGIEISIPDLIVGDEYTISFYAEAGSWLSSINANMQYATAGSVSVNNQTGGIPYGGEPGVGYGQGPYGGVTGAGVDLTTGIWYRPSFTFTATKSTDTLIVTATTGSDIPASTNTNFWIDAILIEAEETVGSYFDGSFGSTQYLDYQWESTAGLSRSYYYEQFTAKTFTVQSVLTQHTPLGITAATPEYVTPFTQ